VRSLSPSHGQYPGRRPGLQHAAGPPGCSESLRVSDSLLLGVPAGIQSLAAPPVTLPGGAARSHSVGSPARGPRSSLICGAAGPALTQRAAEQSEARRASRRHSSRHLIPVPPGPGGAGMDGGR
jgi:hypothetical protein